MSVVIASLAASPPASGVAGFGDIGAASFYTRAVQWMVDRGITTGTTATCFSPDDPLTRGQAAALIWRMEGEPSAPPHAFVDVVAPWQEGPVSWMAHEGLTRGTSPWTFSPDDPITRGQFAAFLHRLAGEPAAAGHPFSDVHRGWQQMPVAWMLERGITTGTGPTTFSPDAGATRGQAATFLWRYKESPATVIDPTHPTTPRCAGQTGGPPTTVTTTTLLPTTTTPPPTTTTTLLPTTTTPPPTTITTPPPTTTVPSGERVVVAFIGDQGTGNDARAVLELIREEGATMVLHQGDFDYGEDPPGWDQTINDVLGEDFAYFASVGNHDDEAWYGPGGYQDLLTRRLDRVPGANCSGEYGVNASCTYQGLFFILSGVGTLGSGHAAFIRDELAVASSRWRICTWHKNQEAMQVGGKSDETGWGVYEECRRGGAMIATGHEHNYSRTVTLRDMSDQILDPAWPLPEHVRVGPGATFAFVSGLGGKSVRDQERCLPVAPPYGCGGVWASIYAEQQGATHGALFCNFGVDARWDKAVCWFKDIDGNVADLFVVTNQN